MLSLEIKDQCCKKLSGFPTKETRFYLCYNFQQIFMSKMERIKALKKIENDIVSLKSSPLYNYRVNEKNYPVIGEGDCLAKIMVIGEAPGKKEAKTGRPFCGASGKILDELFLSINLKREDIYITNIVKDRPPENRDPSPEEIAAYAPFLDKQIQIIKPEIIVTLGRYSMMYIMAKFGLESQILQISKMHGVELQIETSYGKITFVPFYHPAVAIYNRKTKGALIDDFKVLKKFI